MCVCTSPFVNPAPTLSQWVEINAGERGGGGGAQSLPPTAPTALKAYGPLVPTREGGGRLRVRHEAVTH